MLEPSGASEGRPVVVLLTPEEAAEALSIGRTRMYRLMREGTIRSVKVGQSRRVPVQALHDYVADLELLSDPRPRGPARQKAVAPGTYHGRRRPDDRPRRREGW